MINTKTPDCDAAWCCVLAVDVVPINTTAAIPRPSLQMQEATFLRVHIVRAQQIR